MLDGQPSVIVAVSVSPTCRGRGAFVGSWPEYITISLFMVKDEKMHASGELCRGKEGIGVDLLRSLYKRRNGDRVVVLIIWKLLRKVSARDVDRQR